MVLEKQDSGICLAMDTGSPSDKQGVPDGSGAVRSPMNKSQNPGSRMRDRDRLNRLAARYADAAAFDDGGGPTSVLPDRRRGVPSRRSDSCSMCQDCEKPGHNEEFCAQCRKIRERLQSDEHSEGGNNTSAHDTLSIPCTTPTSPSKFDETSLDYIKTLHENSNTPSSRHHGKFGSPLSSPIHRRDSQDGPVWERKTQSSSQDASSPSNRLFQTGTESNSSDRLCSPGGNRSQTRDNQGNKSPERLQSGCSYVTTDGTPGSRVGTSPGTESENVNNTSTDDVNYTIWRRQSLSARDRPGYLATVRRTSSVKDKHISPRAESRLSGASLRLKCEANGGQNGATSGEGSANRSVSDLESSMQSSEQSTDSSKATSPGEKSPTHTSGMWQQKLQGALSSFTSKFSSKPQQPQKPVTRPERPARPAVKPQDQKILSLMLAKKEAELIQKANRELPQSQWEARRSEELGRGLGAGHIDSAARKERRAAAAAAAAAASKAADTERAADAKRGTANQISREKRTSIMEKQSAAVEKRKSVEQRLEQQRREMEEQKELLKQKQQEDLIRAESIRASRDQQLLLRSKLKKVAEQQRMEKLSEMKHQSMLELNDLQAAIESKMTAAEQNIQRQRERNSRRHRELQQKIEQSRQRQQQTEEELKKWQEELLLFKEWQGQHAEKLARQALLQKKEAACNERLKKEKQQRENMNKLLEKEERWLEEIEASIAEKEQRSAMVLKDKEDVIQRSRAMAATTQRMREELRSHYSMTDLDKWSQQASIENRLTTRRSVNMGSNTSINSMFQ